MTATSDTIIRLISYTWKDWAVTLSEETAVLGALRADRDMPATIRDLQAAGRLNDMLLRVTGDNARTLAEVLGGGSDKPARAILDASPSMLNPDRWAYWISQELHENYRDMGAHFTSAPFNAVPYNDLIPVGPGTKTKPFGGSGATGIPASSLSVPRDDQALMVVHHQGTLSQYRNPIPGSLPDYLATLSPDDRRRQAELLLRRPIVSFVTNSYIGGLPSRAQVMKLAAKQHRLHPATVAAFILAEQRDQSQNEDAVDLAAAQSIVGKDTSIGLGQVVVSTARREDLFSRLLSLTFRKGLIGSAIAQLLASDEFNIFAVAKYIRLVADQATGMTRAGLPNTAQKFPGIDFAAFGNSSELWPADNLRALGSEYTSTAWDDNLSPGWGDFVFQAYSDIQASKVF